MWQQRGDTLIEVTVALAILATVLSTAYALINLTFRVGQTAKERTQAVSYAQEQAEAIRSYRDQSQGQHTNFTAAMTALTSSFFMAPTGLSNHWVPVPTGAGGHPISGTLYTINVTSADLGGVVQKYRFTITVNWASNTTGPANTTTLVEDLVNIDGLGPCDNSVSGSCI